MTSAIMHKESAAPNEAAVLSAIQGERRRVARNIHDVVLQDLTAILLQLRAASKSAVDDAVIRHLGHATAAAEQGLAAARSFLRELRREDPLLPPSEDTALAPLLQEAVMHASRVGSAEVLCEFHDDVTLPRQTGDELALILREALVNALKHANARQVLCQLLRRHDAIEVRVSDDGAGFVPNRRKRGFGLNGMRERAALLGGTLTIHSTTGSGTMVSLRLPCRPASAL